MMSELAELQKKYVFVPTDKAANNIAVVCKRFYIEKTMQELNIFSDDQKNHNSTRTEQVMKALMHLSNII